MQFLRITLNKNIVFVIHETYLTGAYDTPMYRDQPMYIYSAIHRQDQLLLFQTLQRLIGLP